MANEQNLRPSEYKFTQEEAKKGGIQSGVARRRKRTVKQAMELVMSLPVSDKKVQAKLKKMGIDLDDADNQTAVVVGLMARAMKGDPKACALLFEHLEDGNASSNEQAESHNALIDAIRMRKHED